MSKKWFGLHKYYLPVLWGTGCPIYDILGDQPKRRCQNSKESWLCNNIIKYYNRLKKHPVRKTKFWIWRWYNQIFENPSVFSAGFILWLLDQTQLTPLLHSSIFMASCQHTQSYTKHRTRHRLCLVVSFKKERDGNSDINSSRKSRCLQF